VQQKERILVVERDDLILGLLEQWLGEAGYDVVVGAAQSLPPPDAGAKPRLVIVDVPRPRSAEKMIKSVKDAYGGPILLLSARLTRSAGSSSDVARRLGVRKVLPKPFTRSELLAAVTDSISLP
jgi:DNA-binding response OmpR family regulator